MPGPSFRPSARFQRMLHYFLKRLLGLLPTLFLVAVIVFLFVHMLPGDPARLAAGPEADQVTVELVRKDLGLDKPLPEQFITYFGNIITKGDFGTSLRTKRPVSVEIGERFAATFWLTVWSMVWSVFFGLIIGMISATKRNKWQDHAGMALAVSGISFPTFALGLLLMEIFSVSERTRGNTIFCRPSRWGRASPLSWPGSLARLLWRSCRTTISVRPAPKA